MMFETIMTTFSLHDTTNVGHNMCKCTAYHKTV